MIFLPVLIFRFQFVCFFLVFFPRVRQTPEEGRRTYRPKCCGNNNKDEENSPKNLNDKNQQASSQWSVASTLEISAGFRRPSSRLLPTNRGDVYCLAPEAPLLRGIPTGPKVFLAISDAYGLRPSDQTYFKNGLVPYLSGGGTDDKYTDQTHVTQSRGIPLA